MSKYIFLYIVDFPMPLEKQERADRISFYEKSIKHGSSIYSLTENHKVKSLITMTNVCF